jgi:hypothetical protein
MPHLGQTNTHQTVDGCRVEFAAAPLHFVKQTWVPIPPFRLMKHFILVEMRHVLREVNH